MLTREDVTVTFVPNLYQRSLHQIYQENDEHRDSLWRLYHQWRLINRIKEHKKAMKAQTTLMLAKHHDHFERQKVLKDREFMFETFGRAMYTKDKMKYRNLKFKRIK